MNTLTRRDMLKKDCSHCQRRRSVVWKGINHVLPITKQKKTLFYPVYGIILATLLTGCHFNNNSTVHSTEYPITIDLAEAIRNKIKIKLSDIVDSITYVPVESMIDDYITHLNSSKMQFSQNYVISEGYRSRGDLVLYDRNGRFIRKVAQKGQGPGEYSGMNDIAIDEKHEIVYVLSASLRKLFKYNLEGIFLGVIDLSDFIDDVSNPPTRIAVSSSGQILVNYSNWTGNLQYRCLLFDHQGNLINRLKNYLFYTGELTSLSFEGKAYIYKNQIHVKNYCDTLFVVDNDNFKPKYVFRHGKNQSNYITCSEYKEIGRQVDAGDLFETDSKVFFSFGYNNRFLYAFYDKNEGKTYSISDEFLKYNDDGLSFPPLCVFSGSQLNDETILILGVDYIDRNGLKEHLSSSKYLNITNMLDSILSVDDDPVVLSVFHLKKNYPNK